MFIDDTELPALWSSSERYYLVTQATGMDRLATVVGAANLIIVARAGGKLLLTNQPLNLRASERLRRKIGVGVGPALGFSAAPRHRAPRNVHSSIFICRSSVGSGMTIDGGSPNASKATT